MSEQLKTIRETCRALFEEGQVVELRAVGVPVGWADDAAFTYSGYFDDFDALAGAAARLDHKRAKGTYVTLNPVQPDLLARRKNKIRRCGKGDPHTKNEEIEWRRWLPLDFDPVRPAGISSTAQELKAARERAIEAARYLKEKGWPGGLLAESGNGAHLLYRIDLPADDLALTRRVLKALAEKFSDDAVELDTGVHSAGQIWKLYGTTARKGDETEERPHRRARILCVADEFRPVPVGKLQALAIKPTNGHKAASENAGDMPTEEVEKALFCIPPRPDYETWYRIAAAVKDALGGDINTAVSLLKAWSPEEEPGEYRRKLESGFKDITAGTLYWEAEKHGYVPPWKQSRSSQSVRTNGQTKQKRFEASSGEKGSEGASRKEMTQAERLLTYAEDVDLFHTPGGETYASFEASGAYRTAAISSAAFGKYLRRLFYRAEGRPPSAQALQDTRDVMSARAEFDGPEREVHLRVASHGRYIYIDLGNERWDLVEIDRGGWRIVRAENAPVRFRRTPGMKALPKPRRGGSLALLRSHIRVASDGEFALLLAWLVQALNPEGPYPALELIGEQGTGKSTTARLIRALIDPHRASVRTKPRAERDLMVAADNGWLLSFDNLSGLPHWLSDAFCRLATGGAFGTRKLYSNRAEEIFYAKRPLILNGIENLTTRPDLADRTVTLRLSPIPESKRKTEKELRAKFEKDWPLILGALFDAVATALRNAEKIELEKLPRMADFARWGAAAEEAFPTRKGTFLRAYAQGRREASEEAVESSTVASAVRAMLKDRGEWTGKTSTLLEDLRAYLPDPKKPPKDYPKTYQAMGAVLRRVMPVLRDVGIEKEEDPRERSRAFTLRKITGGNEAEEANGAYASSSTGQNQLSERAHPSSEKRTSERAEANGSAQHNHELSPPGGTEAPERTHRAHRSLQMSHQSNGSFDSGHEAPTFSSNGHSGSAVPHRKSGSSDAPTLQKKQRVMTPKGPGTVVKIEGRTVYVELDDAPIGKREAFDLKDVEPLSGYPRKSNVIPPG